MSAIADFFFGDDKDAAHVDPRAGLTPAEADAQAACLAAYGAKEGMSVFAKVFNEPKACAGDERSLVAAAARAVLAERQGPPGVALRPAAQALGAAYDALRGHGWKVAAPGWRPAARAAAVSAWHGVDASWPLSWGALGRDGDGTTGTNTNAGLLAVLGDALLGEGTFTAPGQTPVVALRLPNNQLAGPAGTGLLQPLAGLQAGGGAALAEINVAGNALTGPLPAEPFAQLPNLAIFVAGFNGLSGAVPFAALGAGCPHLTTLSLPMNKLEGPVPAFGKNCCPNLKVLHLYGNPELGGPLPPSLGELACLEELRLWGCRLTGRLPPELGGCARLKVLHLAKNQLAGDVPSELGACGALQYVYLHDNLLTGEVPAAALAAGWLRVKKLTLGSNPQLGGVAAAEAALRQSRGGPTKVDFSYREHDVADAEGTLFDGGGTRRGSFRKAKAPTDERVSE